MKKLHLILSLLAFTLCNGPLNAQVYHYITHQGSQTISGNAVTVSFSPTGSIYAPGNATLWCGAQYGVANGSMNGPNPGNITFDFGTTLESIRLFLFAMEEGDTLTIGINGNLYPLTNANLSPHIGGMAICTPRPVVANGIYITAPGVPAGVSGGATVTISGAINTVTVHGSGIMNGTSFKIAFRYIDLHTDGSPVCQGDSLKLFVHTDELSGTSYSWTGPNGFSSTLQNPVIPNVTTDYSGTYTVTIATSEGVFTDSMELEVLPRPMTEILYNEPVCAGMELRLSDTSTLPGTLYQWTGPTGFSSTGKQPVIPNIRPDQAGTYRLTTTLGECSFTAEKEIMVGTPVPHRVTDVFCANSYYDFNGQKLYAEGVYYDTIPVKDRCDSIIMLNLIALPAPAVNLLTDITGPLCLGDTVSFKVEGDQGNYQYSWYGNQSPLGDGDQKTTVLKDPMTTIIAVGASENDCRDTAAIQLPAEGCCELFIPNVFSPNSDGMNDLYGSESLANFSSFRLAVFNRWGQKVFEGYTPTSKWDGTFMGKPMETGSYFYFITATCYAGEKVTRKGDLLLIR